MATNVTRREARELLLGLVYEMDFRLEEDKDAIFELSSDVRDIPENGYIKNGYFTICEKLAEIDECIAKHSVGWKTERMSRVSRAILRLGAYELLFADDIPSRVTINEAIELSKKFDDDKAKAFINGILNAIKDETGEKK